MQKYSILLWKKAEEKEFDDVSKEAYNALSVLQNYSEMFRPIFLTTNTKSNAVKIDWSFNSFVELLKNGINRNRNKVFNNLGYSLSFFSSLKEDESCSISIRVGVKDNRFFNTLIIDLPTSFDIENMNNSLLIYNIFSELVVSFNPFWGCVVNNKLKIGDDGLLKDNKPVYLHWLNYFSESILSNTNIGFFEILKNISDIDINNGIIRMQKKALNCENENDYKLFQKVNSLYHKG